MARPKRGGRKVMRGGILAVFSGFACVCAVQSRRATTYPLCRNCGSDVFLSGWINLLTDLNGVDFAVGQWAKCRY